MMKIRNWATAISLFFLLNIVLMAGCSPIISQKTLTQNTEISAVDANNLIATSVHRRWCVTAPWRRKCNSWRNVGWHGDIANCELGLWNYPSGN